MFGGNTLTKMNSCFNWQRKSSEEVWSPLSISSCVAGIACHRMSGCLSDYIFTVRDANDSDTEYSVYDFQQNTSNFKTSAGGSWIDGSGMSLFVKDAFFQNSATLKAYQNTPANQPALVLDGENGYPEINFYGGGKYLIYDTSVFEAKTNLSVISKINNDGSGQGPHFAEGDGSLTNRVSVWEYDNLLSYLVSNSSSGTGNISYQSGWYNDFLLFDGAGAGSSDRMKAFWDNVEKTLSFTRAVATVTASSHTQRRIGNYDTGTAFSYGGKLSFLGLYTKTISINERGLLNTYLNEH